MVDTIIDHVLELLFAILVATLPVWCARRMTRRLRVRAMPQHELQEQVTTLWVGWRLGETSIEDEGLLQRLLVEMQRRSRIPWSERCACESCMATWGYQESLMEPPEG